MKRERNRTVDRKSRSNSADRRAGNKYIRRIVFAAAAAMIITGCASGPGAGTPAEGTAPAQTAQETVPEEQTSAGQGMTGAAEGAGTAETAPEKIEQEELVTVVIPTVYESVTTQEEADGIREKNGYESAVLEEDGSLTITMTRSRHDEMIRQFRDLADKGISEILAADTGSVIEKIEYNDDYSVFTVTVVGDEIGIAERQTADELVMYGTLYHIYTGNDVEHIQVDYVSRESGEVIESADSGSLSSAY